VQEHAPDYPSQWVAIRSVAEKLGCSVEALRRWVRQRERDGVFLIEASSRSTPFVPGRHRAPFSPAITAQPTTPLPRRLCRSRQRYIVRAHAFLRLAPPRWAFSSPLAFTSSRLVPNRKSGCRDHIALALRPTWRTATASPKTIPRHAGTQINQAAGHAIIWGGPLGVRCHAQGPRHGELSLPRCRWRVCAIDCILRKRAHSHRVARRVVGKLFHLAWRTRHTRPGSRRIRRNGWTHEMPGTAGPVIVCPLPRFG
jgi:transposase-like protein